MGDQEEKIRYFTQVTGLDDVKARFFLECADWNIEVATENYYEAEIMYEPSSVAEEQNRTDTTSSERERKTRFATVASITHSQPGLSSDEEEGQAYYAGGSEHSGQQVLGPPKRRKDIVSEMFQSVQEQGAEIVDPRNPSTSKRRSTFTGRGYRLGQSATDSEVVHSTSAAAPATTDVVLKLWKEGFSIDDGDLREYTAPGSKEFLDAVRKGEIPEELLHEASGKEVHLNMEDHRNETFQRKVSTPRVKAFSGKGHMLGSPSPTITSPSSGTTPPSANTSSNFTSPTTEGANTSQRVSCPSDTSTDTEELRSCLERMAQDAMLVNDSQPTTTIQIRLFDGSRLVGTFNHTHTIGDIRRFITIARPQYENQNFMLLTMFPSQTLSNDSQTIVDAGILNSAIIERPC